jgi:hypothetical protein
MAITALQALNRTLVKLRESEVTDITGQTSYVNMVMQLVNEAKEEVEEAFEWNYQNTTTSLSVVAGTDTYELNNWGDNFVIDLVYDSDKNFTIKQRNTNAEIDAAANFNVVTSTSAYQYTLYGVSADGDPQIKFYPNPGAATTVKVLGRVKQSWLSDKTTVMLVPWRPVVALAYAKAISERGEDGGMSYEEAQMEADRALARAITAENALGHIDKNWKVG